jgi:hypothetical protein
MVVMSTEDWPNVLRGWNLGSLVVARGSDPERLIAGSRDVLTPGGSAAVYNRVVEFPPDEAHPKPYWDSVGIYRVDVATGKNERAGFEARPMENSSSDLAFGGSPDTKSVIIAQDWRLTGSPAPDFTGLSGKKLVIARGEFAIRLDEGLRTTISLATFDGGPTREVATLNARFHSSSADGTSIQWAPNGRLVAIGLLVPRGVRPWTLEVQIFDTTTWDVVARYENARLAGSACWGPDSDRLLLEHEINTNWIQHLDGTRQPITVLAPRTRGNTRPIRPIGMADNDHLLTLRLPEDRATIMRTSIADGTHEGLFAWTGEYLMYPVIAQMPPETWA